MFHSKEGLRLGPIYRGVLREICDSVGFEYSFFATKQNLIDESLLESRNTIAHGEFIKIEFRRYVELHDQVIGMMEVVKTLAENAAVLEKFKRT